MGWENVRSYSTATGAQLLNSVVLSIPVNGATNLWTTISGQTLQGQIPGIGGTNGNSGHVSYCGAHIEVEYAGTELNKGGTVMCLDGRQNYSLCGDNGAGGPSGPSFDALSTMSTIVTAHRLGSKHGKYFRPQSRHLNELTAIPEVIDNTQGVGAEFYPLVDREFAEHGWTQGMFVTGAVPAQNYIFRVSLFYDANISYKQVGTLTQLAVPSKVATANPVLHAKYGAAIAAEGLKAAHGVDLASHNEAGGNKAGHLA